MAGRFEGLSDLVECPLIIYTDLDTSFCKALEETLLTHVEHPPKSL